jgi:hypothetical protein
MKITDLTSDNINFIVDNMWERGRRELDIFGISIENFRVACMSMVGQPWALMFCDDDMTPAALCFLQPLGDGRWSATLQATEAGFNKIWLPLTRFFTAFSNVILKDHGGAIRITAVLTHPKKSKWFSVMGFRKDSADGKIENFIKKAGQYYGR